MFKKFARFKITGGLINLWKSPEGNKVKIEKTLYACYWWSAWLKMEYLRLFYDYVEMQPIEKSEVAENE